MTPRAIAALGIGQCVNWGVLYYAFVVLVLPLERELGIPTWAVTGAFSFALLVSAAAAPTIGRWADRGRGPLVMQAGGIAAAGLLIAWTFMPGALALYLVWSGLGVCMAATLYEPAFAIVGRTVDEPSRRLRTLATVTLFGGIASTVFLPSTSWLVRGIGWRGAVLVLAALLLLSTATTRVFVFRGLATSSRKSSAGQSAPTVRAAGSPSVSFAFVVSSFAIANLASAGFSANVVRAFGERGVSPASAAMLGGLVGVMQLPGRVLLMNGRRGRSPAHLVFASGVLHAVGLTVVAASPSMLVAATGTMIFALGAGLTTLVRPHVIQTLFANGDAGYLNGRVARHQQLARAAGPLAIAWLGGIAGYAVVFVGLGAAFAVLALASQRVFAERPGCVHCGAATSSPM
jgi:MFS family permease